MRYEIRRATVEDLYEIINDPSPITDEEFRAHGLTRWQALKVAREWFNQITTDTLYIGGKPVCSLGHNQHADFKKGRVTWFVSSPAFWTLGARTAALGKRYFRTQQWKWPGYTFYSYSKSEHPDTDRWFTLMGFTVKHEGGNKLFKLLPNIEESDTAPVAC
jgi:hypothetical protein